MLIEWGGPRVTARPEGRAREGHARRDRRAQPAGQWRAAGEDARQACCAGFARQAPGAVHRQRAGQGRVRHPRHADDRQGVEEAIREAGVSRAGAGPLGVAAAIGAAAGARALPDQGGQASLAHAERRPRRLRLPRWAIGWEDEIQMIDSTGVLDAFSL